MISGWVFKQRCNSKKWWFHGISPLNQWWFHMDIMRIECIRIYPLVHLLNRDPNYHEKKQLLIPKIYFKNKSGHVLTLVLIQLSQTRYIMSQQDITHIYIYTHCETSQTFSLSHDMIWLIRIGCEMRWIYIYIWGMIIMSPGYYTYHIILVQTRRTWSTWSGLVDVFSSFLKHFNTHPKLKKYACHLTQSSKYGWTTINISNPQPNI